MSLTPDGAPKSHHVYCDESQTSGQRFVVYGGIILTANNAVQFDTAIAKWRAAHSRASKKSGKRCGTRRAA